MNDKLKQLEAENRQLLTEKSQEELERIQLKKQSMTLSLKNTTTSTDVQTDTMGLPEGARTTGTETCDTFHTANSDCSFASALPSPFPPKAEAHHTPASDISSLPDDGKALMSDSGVCLDAKINEASATSSVAHPLANHRLDADNLSTNSTQNFYEQLLQSQMGKLREEIAAKKAKIMKILELGGEKSSLDIMINEMQDLQKDYVKLEMRLENSRGENFNLQTNLAPPLRCPFPCSLCCIADGCVSDGEMSTELREVTGSSTDSDERHNPLTMSTMSTRNNSLTASMFAHHIMTRSLPSIEGSFQSQSLREYTDRSGPTYTAVLKKSLSPLINGKMFHTFIPPLVDRTRTFN
jgi:kinesin family member 16B